MSAGAARSVSCPCAPKVLLTISLLCRLGVCARFLDAQGEPGGIADRSVTRHPRHADPEGGFLRTATWIRRALTHPANIERPPRDPTGLPLPSVVPTRAPGLDHERVG